MHRQLVMPVYKLCVICSIQSTQANRNNLAHPPTSYESAKFALPGYDYGYLGTTNKGSCYALLDSGFLQEFVHHR